MVVIVLIQSFVCVFARQPVECTRGRCGFSMANLLMDGWFLGATAARPPKKKSKKSPNPPSSANTNNVSITLVSYSNHKFLLKLKLYYFFNFFILL